MSEELRRRIYTALVAISAIPVSYGLMDHDQSIAATGLIVQTIGLLYAMYNAIRHNVAFERMLIYGFASALNVVAIAWGFVSPETANLWMNAVTSTIAIWIAKDETGRDPTGFAWSTDTAAPRRAVGLDDEPKP